ncbi:hypothetical protein FKW77_010476 [Venturia effusa]|uniref:Uncharacterized protein n=1 Tax=Venturia effusa TaxID=50376 RepID=A0A517L0J0_9PEZI|nr:hypothetical protein FKW77_010476 [Venturia effusa]
MSSLYYESSQECLEDFYQSRDNIYDESYYKSFEVFGMYNLPTRQDDGLVLEDQCRLWRQRLSEEKEEARQQVILQQEILGHAGFAHDKEVRHSSSAMIASSVLEGKTINQQRAYFHQKSRPFALEPDKTHDPLPNAIGDLTLKQLANERPRAAPTPIVASSSTPVLDVVPAAVGLMPQAGPGKMYDIFAEEEDFFFWREMLALPAKLTSPSVKFAFDIFSEEDAVFGDLFAEPTLSEAPTVLYTPASSDVAFSPTVKKYPLSKLDQTIRKMKLRIPGLAMSALIDMYKEMEADGRVTYPVPEPVVTPVVASVPPPMVPDSGSDEETLSGSEKGTSNGTPNTVSSVSDSDDFIMKIDMTPFPTPTKVKGPRPQTLVKAINAKAITSEAPATSLSPMDMSVETLSRPDSPTSTDLMNISAGRGKPFTPILDVIESSPTSSPSNSKGKSSTASPFAYSNTPSPTRARRAVWSYAPILSPIQDGEVKEQAKTESALDSKMPTIQVNGTELIELGDLEEAQDDDTVLGVPAPPFETLEQSPQEVRVESNDLRTTAQTTKAPVHEDPMDEDDLEELEDCPITTIGWIATNISAYLMAQSIRIAPISVVMIVGVAVLAGHRFLDKQL